MQNTVSKKGHKGILKENRNYVYLKTVFKKLISKFLWDDGDVLFRQL